MNNLILVMFIVVIVIGLGLLVVISLTKRGGTMLNKDKYRSKWLAITQNAGTTPESLQFAIISADKLLDTALQERGVRGSTLGERLKNSDTLLSSIDDVWKAHKLRNKIAHDVGVRVSRGQADGAMKIFKRALTDLGAL